MKNFENNSQKVIINNIKYYMNKNNITLEELIEKTSFNKNDFDRIFNYELLIAPWGLKEICDVLSISKKDILEEKN